MVYSLGRKLVFYLGEKSKPILNIHLGHEETPDMRYICPHSTQNRTHYIHLCAVYGVRQFEYNILIFGINGNVNKALL